MGFCKLIDAMVFGLVSLVSYGVWIVIFGFIGLVLCVIFWPTIKVILAGAAMLCASIIVITYLGEKFN